MSSYVRITRLQRAALAVGSAFIALANPKRADMVAVLGETTGVFALRQMRDNMAGDPTGRLILKERPRVTDKTVNLPAISLLPKGTFGKAYADFMTGHHYSPDERPPVRFVEDEELAYVLQRYREAHDFWHVLLGMPPTVLGELAVKWVEATQTGLPMALLSSLIGPLRLSISEQQFLSSQIVPWAIQCARSCPYLLNVYYEKLLEEDLSSLRERLKFVPPPLSPLMMDR
mmetsp:Transcript_28287/g.45819  ORF Transcript_28287/g.45819 Transcript_28287/m.45819 type:complete len:230 (-) Transcript_28287:774-1463(-)